MNANAFAFTSPRTRLLIALLAIASLTATILTVGSEAARAGADATVAKKKKCRPGFKKVRVKGKRKCRPAAGPRATLTWTNGTGTPTDLDLAVWDPFGNRAGGIPVDAIPDADIGTGDNQAFGPEVFTDFLTPAIRNFSFGVCVSNDNGTDDTVATLVFRPPDGSTQTVTTPAGALANDNTFVLLHLGSFNPGLLTC